MVGEAVSTAVYLINRSTNTANPEITPYELAFKMKPHMDHLRVFGSQGYAHIDNAKRTKLESKSFKCMFLGYAENVKGYRVYDLEAGKIKVSRSVKLDEREVDGIYDTQVIEPNTVIQVTKDVDENNIQQSKTDQPILDEPMEAVEDNVADIEMDNVADTPSIAVRQLPAPERPVYNRLELAEFRPQQEQQEDRLVFRPEMERRRRRCEPMLMLGNGQEDEELKEESDSPPTPKRARID